MNNCDCVTFLEMKEIDICEKLACEKQLLVRWITPMVKDGFIRVKMEAGKKHYCIQLKNVQSLLNEKIKTAWSNIEKTIQKYATI